jgi:predicted nuclease of restriction endonuclease-like RecB superfamily
VLPKVAIAVEYFESLVGRERQELDPEVLVQFFGDHKLARCVVAALVTTYQYRSPSFADVISRTALRRLQRLGIDTPRTLRAHLYEHLNGQDGQGDGFLRRAERAPTFTALEGRLGLRPGQLDQLLYLDAPEHARLRRVGAVPAPPDVAAQFNVGVLETLLRHGESVSLTLTAGGAGGAPPAAIRALAAAADVDVSLHHAGVSSPEAQGTLELRIAGRQDVLGSWARHGRRVARLVIQLLERGRPAVIDGAATISLRDRRAVLRLTPELLDILAGAPAPAAGWEDLPGWDAESLVRAIATWRGAPGTRQGRAKAGGTADHDRTTAEPHGWSLRRLPDPQAWAAGVLTPDVLLHDGATVLRVCAVRSPGHGRRLAAIAPHATSGQPLLFAGRPEAVAPLLAAGVPAVSLPAFTQTDLLAGLAARPAAA